MAGLLDVNVLVALLVPTHEHHVVARQWVVSRGATEGWATCPVTELGVIRVCAQLPFGSRPPRATADTLLQFRVSSRGYLLLGLARRYGGQVVTCDQALAISGGEDVINLLSKGSEQGGSKA